ncbi:MAG TPA: suppressor of fused domain protein [Acidimicrobiales bacterium]|nr:suppressor of fused domain protein [Acidimicrobiales bacterium]
MKGPPWPIEATSRTSLESYLRWLDEQAGVPGAYEYVTEPSGDDQPVLSIRYMDCPQAGTLLGFTFGISAVANPMWGGLRPELAICVDSEDARWAWALADIGDRVRTTSVFLPGDTIEIGEPISPESEMDSFVLWHQLITDDDATFRIGDHEIVLVQAIPLHQAELDHLRRQTDRAVGVRDLLRRMSDQGLAVTDVRRATMELP